MGSSSGWLAFDRYIEGDELSTVLSTLSAHYGVT
jgi:hypothetical protein